MACRVENQMSSFERPEVEAAVADMADSGTEARGVALTRREVVDFILNLAGYSADQPLHRARRLEACQREVSGWDDVVGDLGAGSFATKVA
jgi:hypothetical protein